MKIGKKIAVMAMSVGMLTLGFTGMASAHVVVRPSDAKTGAYQTFTVSVPVERKSPTVEVRLDIPMGVTSVRPTQKPGWTIQMDRHTENGETMVSAITWKGGEVGVDLRDDFTFSAKTPSEPAELQWKAYQTYKDGTVVSWDQESENSDESENATTGPFSVTKVAADSDQDKALKEADNKAGEAQQAANKAMYVGIGGAVVAVIAIVISLARKPKAPSQL